MKHSANSVAQAYRDNAEPSVEEIMSDPIIRQLMQSDRVSPDILDTLQSHVAALKARLSMSDRVQ